ncbi:unnamed protein product [Colias eurytheme]|nr:unnamed protein product [Colias eurytheme]
MSDCDIIALTETFLTSSVLSGELFPPGYEVLRADRAGDVGWGGVLLAVRDCYTLHRLTNVDGLTSEMEIIFAIVSWKNVKFLFCVVYLPPNYNDHQYLSVLNCIENVICQYPDLEIIIVGDFNLNSCSINVKNNFDFFCEFCELTQFNNVCNKYDGLLDLVLSGLGSNHISVSGNVEPLVQPDAYHPPLLVKVSFSRCELPPVQSAPSTSRPNAPPNWNFRKADLSALYSALCQLNWSNLKDTTDVDCAVETFYQVLYECISTYVPLKKQRRLRDRYVYPSWFTPEIIRNIKHKYFHLTKYKTEGKMFNKELFKYYRGHVKMLIDNAYSLHIKKTQDSIKDEPAKFWEYVKDKRKSRRNCESFMCDSVKVEGAEAAAAFARYFESVFQPSIPRLDPEAASSFYSADSTRITIDYLREKDIDAAVKRLKLRSSIGPDGIPTFLVKDCVSVLKEPLLHIYNLSLEKAIYPQRWKNSRVTPVPKTDKSVEVSNFRPIAVLSVFAKIFESMLDNQINQQVSNFLVDCQHGFRKNRSTNTNHINFIDYVASEMDIGNQVDTVYFDFKKAFDLVDNDVLLQKLAVAGFTPKLLRFFSSYLRDRSQFVRVSGHESDDYYTRSGVSQGSTLGPTLFLLMINDLPSAVRAARCLMFADDLKLFLKVRNDSDAKVLQEDINAIAQWSSTNHLPFNTDKCKVMTFSRSRFPLNMTYNLFDIPLEKIDVIRDLGLIVDSRLDFHSHMMDICKKANKTLGFIIRVSSEFNDNGVAMLLFNAYVRSKLEYGAMIWDPYETKYSLMIERVQRKFARCIYKRRYGYYPHLYPSMYVLGMVGLNTLALRRKILLVVHYYLIMHNKIDNRDVLEQMILSLPRGGGDGTLTARRPHRLFAQPLTRTHRARNAPTARARKLLGDLLAQYQHLDFFTDSMTVFIRYAIYYLDSNF